MSGASKAGASVDGTPGVGEKTLADRGRRRRDRTDVVDGPLGVEQRVKPAKTSAAAAFALALGVAAVLCVLTVVLSPVGLVLAILGLVLGLVALSATKKPGITGRTVAKVGLVLSVLALLASIAFAAGAVTVLNNQGAVDRIETELQKVRDNLPTTVPDSVTDAVPGQ